MTNPRREALAAILEAEPGQQCAQCNTTGVRWRLSERGNYLTHDGARPSCRFPCPGECEHLDCYEAHRMLEEARMQIVLEMEEALG